MRIFARAGKPTRGLLAVRPRPTPRPTAAAKMSAAKMADRMHKRLHDAFAGGADSNESAAALPVAVEASDMAADRQRRRRAGCIFR